MASNRLSCFLHQASQLPPADQSGEREPPHHRSRDVHCITGSVRKNQRGRGRKVMGDVQAASESRTVSWSWWVHGVRSKKLSGRFGKRRCREKLLSKLKERKNMHDTFTSKALNLPKNTPDVRIRDLGRLKGY
ncbi:uncharacterized protein N7483_005621 [Penicillium malachiteum]|uniref:uncharacterized protein n=1 Tax=Penicillium malachiteum TaxID=1324776 RepID=UPI002548DDA8|nr:uncharacterized protein N7483_005621 [Penicillium malachiteum]KAJ5731113.1 hypothetical protein N7483_005621 [Penicillium malachiteum]